MLNKKFSPILGYYTKALSKAQTCDAWCLTMLGPQVKDLWGDIYKQK